MSDQRWAGSLWLDEIEAMELTSMVNLLAYKLSRHADSVTGKCWPTYEEIERATGMGRRTIERAIEVLEATGFLLVKRSGRGKKNKNVYYVVIPGALKVPADELDDARKVYKVYSTRVEEQLRNPLKEQRAQNRKAVVEKTVEEQLAVERRQLELERQRLASSVPGTQLRSVPGTEVKLPWDAHSAPSSVPRSRVTVSSNTQINSQPVSTSSSTSPAYDLAKEAVLSELFVRMSDRMTSANCKRVTASINKLDQKKQLLTWMAILASQSVEQFAEVVHILVDPDDEKPGYASATNPGRVIYNFISARYADLYEASGGTLDLVIPTEPEPEYELRPEVVEGALSTAMAGLAKKPA